MTTDSIDSPAAAGGTGLFETILAAHGRLFEADAHCARLKSSAVSLGFPAPTREELDEAIAAAAARVSDLDEAAVRCFWVASREPIDDPAAWTLHATGSAIPPGTLERRAFGRTITLDPSWRRAMPQFKTTSHAVAVLALREASRRSADEALFVDRDGHILEGSTTNVFAIASDVLVTPAASDGLLPGIMRAWVMKNAPRTGFAIQQRPLTHEDLLRGSFLTGSLTTIAAVRAVDGRPCAPLDERFAELVRMFRFEVEG